MQPHIAFIPEVHKYVNTTTKEQYTSVTTVISSYKQKFDAEKEAEAYIMRRPNINSLAGAQELVERFELELEPKELLAEGITASRIAKIWKDYSDKATMEGSKYHFIREIDTLYNEGGKVVLPYDYNETITDLSTLPDGVYPELRVWYDPYKLAGTVDKVTIRRPWVWIGDYKTNKRLLEKYNRYDKWMRHPIQFLPDVDYYHYETQLNIYGWIFEQYGFKVKELKIIQKRFDDDKPIPFRYWIPWESERLQRRPIIYEMQYYPERTQMFLEYDYKKRNEQELNLL